MINVCYGVKDKAFIETKVEKHLRKKDLARKELDSSAFKKNEINENEMLKH